MCYLFWFTIENSIKNGNGVKKIKYCSRTQTEVFTIIVYTIIILSEDKDHSKKS